MFKIFPFFVGLFIAFCLPLHAAITVSLSDVQDKIPEGASASNPSEVAIIKMTVSATNQDENLRTITLQNTGPDIFFEGDGISRVSVYLNSDGNEEFSLTEDTLVAAESFSNRTAGFRTLTFTSNDETIIAGRSVDYFIVYDVEANLDAKFIANGFELQTNLTLGTLTTLSGSSFAFSTLPNSSFNANIVGIYSINVVDISPSTILPGATDVPVMRIEFGVAEQSLSNDFFIELFNDQGNFSPSNNQEAGVRRIKIYKDSIASGQILASLLPTQFTSIERAAFTSLTGYQTSVGNVTNNLVITFDIGDDFPIASTSSIKARLTAFSGTQSGSDFVIAQDPPVVNDIEIDVAGLTFLEMTSIVPQDTDFGENQAMPILSFKLRANNTPITINRFILANVDPIDASTRATYPFLTSVANSEGIQTIRVYEDSNFTGVFERGSDTVVASVNTRTANTVSQPNAFLPINDGVGLLIDKFIEDSGNVNVIYPENNDRLFFVEYVSGTLPSPTAVLPQDVSGNRNLRSSVFLQNVNSTANVNSEIVRLDLNGTLPASSVNPAFVEFIINNSTIEGVTSIAPVNAVRGQINLPMLAVNLNFPSPISVASASITIANTVASQEARFSGKNLGVSKIYIYKEPTGFANQSLDTDDVLLASLIVPSTITGANSITLTGANLGTLSGSESFLVMYDIGFDAPDASTARAQFAGLSNDDDVSIELSGELPQPETPASVTIQDQLLRVTQVNVDTTDVSNVYDVSVTVANISGAAVQLINVLPRVYRNSVSGEDISGQFDIVYDTSDPLPVTINASASLTFSFSMTQSLFDFSGIAVLDAYAEYTVAVNSGVAALNRYLSSSGWRAASTVVDTLTMPVVDFKGKVFPGYIDSVLVGGNALGSASSELLGFNNFANGTSLEQGSQMAIVFKNNGEAINEGSLSLQLNNERLGRVNSVSTTGPATFEYNRDDGNVLISNIGSRSGTVILNADDLEGNALETTNISFLISNTEIQLNDVYFYPNPYRIGSEELRLGFDISRNAEVDVYIFNYRAQELFKETYNLSRGYNLISLGSNANFFESGIMLCRVIARDVDGNIDAATAKLAIY